MGNMSSEKKQVVKGCTFEKCYFELGNSTWIFYSTPIGEMATYCAVFFLARLCGISQYKRTYIYPTLCHQKFVAGMY
jgi:hypothetical protein